MFFAKFVILLIFLALVLGKTVVKKKAAAPIPEARQIPNGRFKTTAAPLMATMKVPDKGFKTTTIANSVPNPDFITTPGSGYRGAPTQTTEPPIVTTEPPVTTTEPSITTTISPINVATEFVPDNNFNNFMTTPGSGAGQTTLPQTNPGSHTTVQPFQTAFVPENNFVTTPAPGLNALRTTLPQTYPESHTTVQPFHTAFVPENNFVTTPAPGLNAPQTTLPQTNPGSHTTVQPFQTAFVPENNFVTTPASGLNAPQTTLPQTNPRAHTTVQPFQTAFVPENNFVTTPVPGLNAPQTTGPPLATLNNEGTIADSGLHTTAANEQLIHIDTPPPDIAVAVDIATDNIQDSIADNGFHTTAANEQLVTEQFEIAEVIPNTPAIAIFTPLPEIEENQAMIADNAFHIFTAPPDIAVPVLVTQQFEIAEVIPNTPALNIFTPPSNIELATQTVLNVGVVADSVFHTTSANAQPMNGAPVSTTETVNPIGVRSPAPNIPIVNFMTTTLSPPVEALSGMDGSSSDISFMRSNSAVQLSENSSTSDNHLVTSTQHATSTTPISGLQHHQLGSLLDTILADYYPQFRPRNNQNRFVAIFTDFVPTSIIEFNTQEQKFSVLGYFKMDWRDDFLTWDPASYEGTEMLRIPIHSIWTPKLVIDKAYNGERLVGDNDTDIALINYRGYVRWFPEGIYSVVCKVSIQFYPFDKQTCVFTYFIADEDNSTINLKHDGEIDLTEYIENAEWKLANLSAERKQTDNVYVVNYRFDVERRGGFAMFTLIVPVLMLSVLSGTTFLIPIESGEKCSFSVTVFLAYGIFETIVIDTLPHNSLDVSYFIMYLTSLLIVSVFLTFYTIVQAKIFDSVGSKRFDLLCGSSSNPSTPILTWGGFLQKLDNYVFIAFLILVVGLTSTFLTVMEEKFDIL